MLRQVCDIIPHISEEKLMPEDNQTSAQPDHEWDFNVLANHSVRDIQRAIAKAISELTGRQFTVTIPNVDFAPKWAGSSASYGGHAEFAVHLHEVRKNILGEGDDDNASATG